MTYQTAAAFRRALETRLVAESTKTGTPLVRLRKLVAFDRFLARLLQAYPHDWLLKGGLALQLRMGEHARTTQDVDVLLTLPRAAVHNAVMHALSLDLADWFVFVVRPASTALPGPTPDGGHRFFITALVDRRTFQVTFAAHGADAPPSSLPAPPAAWTSKYQRFAQDVGLDETALPVAFEHARRFLEPVLSGQPTGTWSPIAQAWL